jgi:threonine synthase
MSYVTTLRCMICGKQYAPDAVRYVCPEHGAEGILDVEYDYGAIKTTFTAAWLQKRERGMFAYRPLLPVGAETAAPPLRVGDTPLIAAPRLAAQLGLAELWIKDDGRNPTASLKDRASAVAVMKARELGAEIVTTASTGNAAAALAGLAASVGQRTVIFVPAAAPQAKIAQLLVYGAETILVEGSYDDAFDLCLEASERFGWYCRNTAYNPYMAEGKKTAVFELYEQLLGPAFWLNGANDNDNLPDYLFVSVGDGCIISGLHKGLTDLRALGLLPRLPRLMGVQAAGSSYLYDGWRLGEDLLTKPPIQADTLADSISAGLPRDRLKALRAIQQTNGAFVQVTDKEILAAIPALAQGSGVFAEPAAAAAYAGLVTAVAHNLVPPGARVALVSTGSGLKDVASAVKSVGQAPTVSPANGLAHLQTVYG